MESWKREEIGLLRTDIEERLLQIGLSSEKASSVAQSYLLYTGPGTEQDLEYLNARFRRIQVLCNIDLSVQENS